MKKVMSRSLISLILAVVFLLGLGFLCVKYFVDGRMWASQSYNPYVSDKVGMVLDRNGEVLAQTVEGKRVYSNDESIRKSVLHTVGDGSNNFATSVEKLYRDQLAGYSSVFGYGLPDTINATKDVKLTLDAQVCGDVYDAFGQKKGACFVYNYKTGEVLCMVSAPSYDVMAAPKEIPEGAYINNCIHSAYTPGSIFKIITSAAGFEYIPDIDTRTYTCDSRWYVGDSAVTCMQAHGELSHKNAFAYSCNIAFGEMALLAGSENMQATADKMGINSSFKIGKVNTKAGHFDVTSADDVSLAWAGIGQYTDLVNPAQMAILCGAIAQGGETRLPHYVNGEDSGYSSKLMSTEVSQEQGELMRYTISGYYGDNMFPGLTVSAKTGTGEVEQGKEPNAWMIGYSTDEDCPLAFAVVVEEGGYGFYSAGPIARIAMLGCAESLRG